MKYNILDIGGDIVKDNETYILKDNKLLNNLVVSSTQLHPHQITRGHKHEGQEEVYYFVKGDGVMWLNDKEMDVAVGGSRELCHQPNPKSYLCLISFWVA